MNLTPLHDRIIIRRVKPNEVTSSGIIIPDPEKNDQGDVIAVGAGTRLKDGTVVPLDVKVGDRVMIGKYSGNPVKLDGDELLVVREEDVFAVLGA